MLEAMQKDSNGNVLLELLDRAESLDHNII